MEHLLDAREVEPELGRQPLDQPQPLDVGVGVEPRVAGGALRPHEALLLVDPQRLRVHADELGGDADHVARVVVHQLNSLSRGLVVVAFWNSSSASRCAFVSFAGTVTRTRASRSPRPVALQRRRAAALHAQQLAVLRAGRDLDRDAAVGRRDLDRRAERGLVERDRHLEHEVVAAALVQLRRLDARDDEEVARRRAALAGLALALELDPACRP